MHVLSRARQAAAAATVPLAVTLAAVTMAACGSSPAGPGSTGRNGGAPQVAALPSLNGMNGMGPMAGGNGLSAAADGYRMTSPLATLPAAVSAAYTFTITAPDGTPLTQYATDETKKLHFYAIRSDLTGFWHIHAVMAPGGTWTALLSGLEPGLWRLYATFTPAAGHSAGTEFVLSRTVTVPGSYSAAPLPAPAAATSDDGYTITTAGDLIPGVAMPLAITIARDGEPVTTLQPYLGAYAYLTAIHAGDLAFVHLSPQGTTQGDHGGPSLTFNADLPETGPWRLFLQFQTYGQLHTVPITLNP